MTSSRRTAAADDPGGVSWDNLALTVDPAAGPFLVTSRATAGSPASGAENVTWNVAGTAGAALAPNVKISLSTDGGLTYPTVLSATDAERRVAGRHAAQHQHGPRRGSRSRRSATTSSTSTTPTSRSSRPVPTPRRPSTPGRTAPAVTGSPFTSSGSYTDDVPATVTATVDYGDGAGPAAPHPEHGGADLRAQPHLRDARHQDGHRRGDRRRRADRRRTRRRSR